jgi:hypothetical protein
VRVHAKPPRQQRKNKEGLERGLTEVRNVTEGSVIGEQISWFKKAGVGICLIPLALGSLAF